ncbi:MAG: FtsX-like permease family protein [Candidatus Saccharimonadales bacterium]
MNVATRGIRNAFRNQIRTVSIVVIVGLSIGLTLAMLVARQAVSDKIQSVKSSVGNTITVSPAGVQGFQGGGEPLTTAQLKKVSAIANVTNVTETLSDRLTSDSTNLVSAIDAGTLGNRAGRNSGVGFATPPDGAGGQQQFGGNITRTFTPPVIATGTNDTTSASVYGGNSLTFTSGQALDASKDEDKALVGKSLASKNNLRVGSTFTAYGQTITVAGIYDTGNTFSNAGLVFSLPSLQRLSTQSGDVTSAIVTVNSIDNLDAAVSAIKSSLGSAADVVSNQETAKQTIAPLENVKTISLYSLIGALVAGAVIILLIMIMIVRERRREIGIMKAIGASNVKIMFQFISEAITLTLLGMVVGLVIGAAAASPITKVLVNNSSNNSSQTTRGFGGGGPSGGRRGFRGFGASSVNNVRDIQASAGWSILGYGFSAAMIIAIIGSALPALLISKVRPAEVMRVE